MRSTGVSWARLLIGALAEVVGVVWIGQGLGYIGGSFMTGSLFWAAAGLVAVAVGSSLIVLALRRR